MPTLSWGSDIGNFPYHIQERLNTGQGAMSEVYLATVGKPTEQEPAPPLVVLKIARVLDKHGKFYHVALDNEVERLRRLKHPGIVRIYPIRREGIPNLPYMARSGLEGQPWFSVMEYLPGGSLADLIERNKQLEIGLALEIARSLAATLDYLHSRGQVHLDIKPENILFRSDPLGERVEPVLIDFGIARDAGQSGLTAATVRYSPPERLQATRHSTMPRELVARPHPSMDIYSLGLVLYYMVAGCVPFQGRNAQTVTSAILEGNPTSPSTYQPTLPHELDELILKAIHKDPAERPTAEELAIALEAAAIKLGYTSGGYRAPSLKPSDVSDTSQPGASRWPVPKLMLGMAALITVMLAFIASFTDWERLGRFLGAVEPTTTATVLAQMPPSGTPRPSTMPTPTAEQNAQPAIDETRKSTERTSTPEPPVPTASPTVGLPASSPNHAPTSTSVPTPTERALLVTLVRPRDGDGSSTVVTFEWSPSGKLPPGQYYEIVFWREGDKPFGISELTKKTQVQVEIGKLVENESHPLKKGEYSWGVRLAEKDPYRALELLSDQHWRFRVE
jgi:serine/threonine protein kinase